MDNVKSSMDCDHCSTVIDCLPENSGLNQDEVEKKYSDQPCRCVTRILCSVCHEPATHDTGTSDTYLCGKQECVAEAATEQWVDKELTSEDHADDGEIYKKGDWK